MEVEEPIRVSSPMSPAMSPRCLSSPVLPDVEDSILSFQGLQLL
jgi:hypothetical protein